VVRPFFDQGLLLERLVCVLKAKHWMLQDRNLKEETVLRIRILQDLNVVQHHYENVLQVASKGIG